MKNHEEDDDALETLLTDEEKHGDDEPDTVLSHILVRRGVWNQWNGILEWNGGMEYWRGMVE